MRAFLTTLIALACLAACHEATPEELAQAGSERHRAREYAQAIELYQSSLELRDDAGVRASLARALAAATRYPEAAEQYRLLLQQQPQNGTLWHDYGLLLQTGLNDLRAAEEALFNATKFPPRPPEASYDLGRVLMQRGRYAEAGACFEAAISVAPPGAPWLEDAQQQQIQAFLLAKPR